MVTTSIGIFEELSIGDCVTVGVPDPDLGELDFCRVYGVIMEIKNGAYQIGTKDGIIKGWFQRPDLIKSGNSNTKIDDVLRDKSLCLRDVGKKQSITGGQGVKKCNCKAAKKRCQTAKCNCFKGNVKCGSRCHSNLDCLNKNDE